MAGAWYVWIMAAFFIGAVGIMALLAGIFWIGHWLEKKRTGATHGFLEVPPAQASRPAPRSADLPDKTLPPRST